jgi:hypothetical protein
VIREKNGIILSLLSRPNSVQKRDWRDYLGVSSLTAESGDVKKLMNKVQTQRKEATHNKMVQ